MATLADVLNTRVREAELYERRPGRWVRCVACGHACRIPEGAVGVCKVRFNRGGTLFAPWGYVAGAHCDPIEKKPFYHAWPGSLAFSVGMLGCDLHCGYCQNWVTSQALRDEAAVAPIRLVSPAEIVGAALRAGARLVVSSYNEPLITAEWAAAVFEPARRAGLACALVSNGHATPEVLEYHGPHLTAFKIDLKLFDDQGYRSLGGTLNKVKAGIEMVAARGLGLEVVTLLVPGFNDRESQLRAMARFLRSINRDIPWSAETTRSGESRCDASSHESCHGALVTSISPLPHSMGLPPATGRRLRPAAKRRRRYSPACQLHRFASGEH